MAPIKIMDPESGATATILPERGMNCFRWRVPTASSREDLIWSEEQFADGNGRPSGSGIPILFPFPGRIGGAQFQYGGRRYRLPANDGCGNAIHGFVYDRPWRVIEAGDTFVSGVFRASQDLPHWEELWPADFEITLRYQIAPYELEATLRIVNPGNTTLPCGLGLHPYFTVAADHEQSSVQLPVTEHFELECLIPTGTAAPPEEGGPWPSAGRQWDDVFGGVESDDDFAVARLVDGSRGLQLDIEWTCEFPYCVLYVPPHREAICVEPYSALPDAVNLKSRHVQSGLWELAPGEAKSAKVRMKCEGGKIPGKRE